MINRFAALAALGVMLAFGQGALAQSGNGLQPAEHPPEGFEGSRFVDSAGCVFLRSTFGGEVSWIPLFGADSRPVCNGDPKTAPIDEASTADAEAPEPDPDTAIMTEAVMAEAESDDAAPPDDSETTAADDTAGTPDADTASAAEREPETADPTPPRQIARPAAPAPVAQHAVKSPPVQPRRTASTPPRTPARAPEQDATGRHSACPGNAPYGEPVTLRDGRRVVRCVVAPALMLRAGAIDATVVAGDGPMVAAGGAHPAANRDAPAPGRGAHIQVGSFAVPSNAQRTGARLAAQGLPVAMHRARAGGRMLDVVVVGPVGPGDGLHQALRTVRAMGFSDAFIRR